jgi:hypothetical protein
MEGFSSDRKKGILKARLVGMIVAVLLAAGLLHPSLSQGITEQEEQELGEKYKKGEVSRESLVEMAKNLSFTEKVRLYFMSRELRPYFKPIETAIRRLARTPVEQKEALLAAREQVKAAMEKGYHQLMASDRTDKEKAWRRGLLGLIFLDRDWRKRNEKAGQGEVKNPFDLPKLFDEIDREIRREHSIQK